MVAVTSPAGRDQPPRLVEVPVLTGVRIGDPRPIFSAAALISITAARVITSIAGIWASSRTCSAAVGEFRTIRHGC